MDSSTRSYLLIPLLPSSKQGPCRECTRGTTLEYPEGTPYRMLRVPRLLRADHCTDTVSSPSSARQHFAAHRLKARSGSEDRPGSLQREEIYYATFPLVGLENLERAMTFSGRDIPDVFAQHCAIIVERPSEGRCMLYDFLPEAPTAPATAATLISGRSVKGTVRQRAMRRVPNKRCKWIGTAVVNNAMRSAEEFNTEWDRDLRLFKNDCRNHSAQLAKMLLDNPDWQIEGI